MKSRLFLSAVTLALAAGATPALAQSMDHSGRDMNHAEHTAAMNDDVTGAEAVLTSYRDALAARDAEAMAALFAEESFIYENGKAEGSFTHYMEHHLGPELDAITNFTFGEPTLAVTRMGHMAYGRETYTYRIELADGRVIDREGVATSVLAHDADGWKIVQYHSSSRAPRH